MQKEHKTLRSWVKNMSENNNLLGCIKEHRVSFCLENFDVIKDALL